MSINVLDTVTSPSGERINIVDSSSAGFNALDAEDFLELMIVQLQNQDPTEPTSNEQLLAQISEMRSLQASIDLEEMIELLATSQNSSATTAFTASAAGLIGRTVTGITADRLDDEGNTIPGQEVTGEVDRAILKEGKAYIGIGDIEIPIENISKVE